MSELDIFTAAVALTDPADREAFLDRACAADPALRARMGELLARHLTADSLLDGSPADLLRDGPAVTLVRGVDAPADRGPTSSPGGRGPAVPRPADSGGVIAGRYTLVELIGEGGMGSVYRASQTDPVRRQVALKLIKPGMASKDVLARFEAERQALAMMDHPNIARIYDGGLTPAGQPFFVMELVRGVPLTDYCDAHRLTVEARLQLFVAVCQAVQHAHQKGVIHRDLKPGNVLVAEVDGRPTPKVIDFGLAKATERRLTDMSLADTGAIVGTPAYMSPEQADPSSMDIDTRTDVYALGVMLYELLTGSPPIDSKQFKRGAIVEMLRMVREVEPSRPSKKLSTVDALPNIAANRNIEPARLARLLQGELDWVVMKALEKDRGRRYESANGFAADILRYLADEVVEARPPTAGYRLRKFVRRNKGQVLAASLLLFALVAGLAGTAWGLVTARRAEADERRARTDAEAQKRSAEAVRDFLQKKLLGQADPTAQADALRAAGAPAVARRDITVRELLDRAAAELTDDRLAADFPDQPLAQAELLQTVGKTYAGVGVYPQAAALLARAHARLAALHGADARPTLVALQQLADAEKGAGRPADAVTRLADVTRRMAVALGPDDPETLNGRNSLAATLLAAGRHPDALTEYGELVPRALAALGPDHPVTLAARTGLAQATRADGRRASAMTLFQQAYDAKRTALGPDHPSTLLALSDLAVATEEGGKPADALPLYEEAARRAAEGLGPDHPHALVAAGNLILAYTERGQADRAVPLAEGVSRRFAAALGADHPDTLQSRNNLALAHRRAGQTDRAVEVWGDVVARRTTTLGPDHPDTLQSRSNLAVGLGQLGRWGPAAEQLEQVLSARTAKLGADHPNTLNNLSLLAFARLKLGPPDRGVTACEEAVKRITAALGPRTPEGLRVRGYLAEAYEDAGRPADAVGVLTTLVPDLRTAFGPEHKDTVNGLNSLGTVLLALGRFAEAEPPLRDCLAAREKQTPTDWRTANTRTRLGAALLGQKKYADAEPLLLKGYEGMKEREKTIPTEAAPRIPETLDRLIELYTATNKPDEVKKWRAERAKYPAPGTKPPEKK